MERYNEYKDSGELWLGEIPSHWGVKRLKACFTERNERYSRNESLGILSVMKGIGVIPYEDKGNVGNNAKEDKTQYKVARKGDLVINSMNVIIGSLGITPKDGYISPAYYAFSPRTGIDERYYSYVLSLNSAQKNIRRFSKGIMEIRLKISSSDFLSIPFPVPPTAEQQAIAKYLDTATARIDEAIAQQQKMIDLLNERKQIIINNAVTKGLNPDVPMKDSGVDYIGLIPEHWVVRRMASLGVFSKGGGISRDNLLEEGEPAILYGDIYTKYNYFAEDIKNHVSKKVALASVEVHKNELLMTGSGETKEDIGKTIVFLGNKAYAGGDVIIFKQDNNNSSFLSYALNSSYAKNFRYKESKGEIVVHIYANAVRQLYLALPDITEQNSIVEYLNNKVGIIDSEICVVRKQISLLQERKQIIINDVVTGKVKVS